MRQLTKFGPLMVSLASLGLGACETPTPPPSKAVAELLKPVPNYVLAPCWMQREWAADNARKKTAETGTVVVYRAPCDVDPKKPPAESPATS